VCLVTRFGVYYGQRALFVNEASVVGQTDILFSILSNTIAVHSSFSSITMYTMNNLFTMVVAAASIATIRAACLIPCPAGTFVNGGTGIPSYNAAQ
jgi:hypothetical protein